MDKLQLQNQFGEVSLNDILPGASGGPDGMSSKAITAVKLDGLGSGANSTILATDTILQALAKLQAQINAL